MVVANLYSNEALREIIRTLLNVSSPSREDVSRVKIRVAAKYRLGKVPSNSEILCVLKADEREKLLPVLRRKTTRTISGVTVVAVMTKPHPCPQPEPCAYCPGGPPYGVPQSYTGYEPAAMRGLQNKFDPYMQVKTRIEQLEAIGHDVDKVELIIMGGTLPATSMDYQTWFVQRCLDAITDRASSSLERAKKNAETTRIRNVGITVETRPDWAKREHVDDMLRMGVTRVELGVQHPSDEIYRRVGRTHTVEDVVESTRIMRDAGLKIAYHLMPGLPGSNPEKDLAAFQEIFSDPKFKPDMIKIYPCLVLKGTKAYEWYRQGKYHPYTNQTAADLIVNIKKITPRWIRIMRIQRDIPAQLIIAGVRRSNLRQLVLAKMKEQGFRCNCIRCREVGHRMLKDKAELVTCTPDSENMTISTTRYRASEGEEIFISSETQENDFLIGYLRLRIPSEEAHRPEVKGASVSVIRELHVYGPLVSVGKRLANAWQHRGHGSVLLREAEQVSREDYDVKKILVTSALGTKQYYKRFGYSPDGPYMSKTLEN